MNRQKINSTNIIKKSLSFCGIKRLITLIYLSLFFSVAAMIIYCLVALRDDRPSNDLLEIDEIEDTVQGVFSEEGYLDIHLDIMKFLQHHFNPPTVASVRKAGKYAWQHYKQYGNKEHRFVVVERNGKFYKGLMSNGKDYFRANNIPNTFGVSPWSHYRRYGYQRKYQIYLVNDTVSEITLSMLSLKPSEHIFMKNDTNLVALVVSHNMGGGTKLFEDELLMSKEFNFIFFRFDFDLQSDLVRLTAHVGLKNVYKSHWLLPRQKLMQSFFADLRFDLLLIDFMHPIPELRIFLKNLNKPIIYAMHDHHAVSYDIENDMHLGCNSFTASGASSTLTLVSHNEVIQVDNRGVKYRWDFAELLRRCILVVTPSLRNKQLLKPYYPEISIFSAPNRPTLINPGKIFVRRPEEAAAVSMIQKKLIEQEVDSLSLYQFSQQRQKNLKVDTKMLKLNSLRAHAEDDALSLTHKRSEVTGILRIVVIGALSVGKGSRIIQAVSSLGYRDQVLTIYHAGKGANFDGSAENRVISLGSYRNDSHLLELIHEVDPHVIWFPATRHESYCYVLDAVMQSKYPIVAANTGSFPERLQGRAFTWILSGCLAAEQWYRFMQNLRIRVIREDSRYPRVLSPPKNDVDFPSFQAALSTVGSFIKGQSRSLAWSSRSEEWMEFLALNPRFVLNNGGIDEVKGKELLEQNRNRLPLINRYSLDETLFRDRHPRLKTPFAHQKFSTQESNLTYNKLQLVSTASLLLVWDYLAKNLPTYTKWYSSQSISGQCTKAALLIDPRYSETTFAVTMNIMYNLGPGWDLFIYCHQQCDVLKEEFKGLVTLSELTNMYEYEDNCSGLRVVFRELEDLSLHSAHKVSKWLMDPELWSTLKVYDKVLVFQTDSLLLRRGSIDDFLLMEYPFIGAYGPGVGSDMRTPLGVGMNGGLSLRSPAAMLRCLKTITPEMVNEYRIIHGLTTVAYNPPRGIYFMEDIYYYHALEMSSYSQPPIEVQIRFSVQSAYYRDTMAVHGFDKGWYLTTAQLSMLLSRSQMLIDESTGGSGSSGH